MKLGTRRRHRVVLQVVVDVEVEEKLARAMMTEAWGKLHHPLQGDEEVAAFLAMAHARHNVDDVRTIDGLAGFDERDVAILRCEWDVLDVEAES